MGFGFWFRFLVMGVWGADCVFFRWVCVPVLVCLLFVSWSVPPFSSFFSSPPLESGSVAGSVPRSRQSPLFLSLSRFFLLVPASPPESGSECESESESESVSESVMMAIVIMII